MNYRIIPPEEINDAVIRLPLSKSISNRVLLINALTGNRGSIAEVAQCDDTSAMMRALDSAENNIDIGAAGTAMRFLTAYFAMQPGREVTVDGTERMRRRPVKILVEALRDCGADIEYVGEEGFPPLKIKGRKLKGGEVSLPADVSSQYISALLMVAPYMEHGLRLELTGTPGPHGRSSFLLPCGQNAVRQNLLPQGHTGADGGNPYPLYRNCGGIQPH